MSESFSFKGKDYTYAVVTPYSPTGVAKKRVNIYVRGAPHGKSMVGSVLYAEDKGELDRRITKKLADKQPIIESRIREKKEEEKKEAKIWRISWISNIATRDKRGRNIESQYRVWQYLDHEPNQTEIANLKSAYRDLEDKYPSGGFSMPDPSLEGPEPIDENELKQFNMPGDSSWETFAERVGSTWTGLKVLPNPVIGVMYGYVFYGR